ncbi:SipW-dependent-type signal peptide-containing protein [Methanoculleus chikugoensis]|uniref:SipW-cognate class signal peptide n=1 Tax=Methanoculleus chikugoensis TaxID=118126 RepID=A0ABM7H7F3_9EURY|nr:SipW-dependent-type signal peptide-containing protein [Methanoculleus chikugoensis]BBL68720.1 hypothetical protein MchiMG62_19010 [Methanoculleus chikugoensis]
MKAYLLSVLLVGLALGGMGLGTFAWFTDQEIVEANAIQTGNADLSVKIAKDYFGVHESTLKVTNLVPSTNTWTTMGYIHLLNEGTVPLKWKGYFVKTGGDLVTDGKLQFRISKVSLLNSMSESDVAADVEISDAGTESLFPSGVYTWAQLSNADTTLLTSDNFGGTMGSIDNPLFTRILKVEVKLDENAGNVYANKGAEFKVIFDATQTDNPGWAQTSPAV